MFLGLRDCYTKYLLENSFMIEFKNKINQLVCKSQESKIKRKKKDGIF